MDTPDAEDLVATEMDAVQERFARLYTEYRRVVLMEAYRLLDDFSCAEDVTADVFRIAWEHRGDADYSFQLPWLFRVLRNRIGDEYRRRARFGRLVRRLATLRQADSHPREEADRVDSVRGLVRRLSGVERELVGMVFWNEMTREEVAEVLGCSVNAVSLRLQRVRRKLATQLTELERGT